MELKKLIEKHRRIMFDTAPIVYFIEEGHPFHYYKTFVIFPGQ
jgi:hypothetical protein